MAEPTARAYRDVLAIPGARALIGASAASQIGNWLYNAALLGYVYSATRSAGWVGAATICRLLPYVLLGPFGGAVADRYRRRTVLLAGDALRVLVMAALAATVASAGPVALVLALTALASAAGCAEKPAAMALLPRLVGEARLGPANALLHTVQDLGVVIGPAIGAILLGVAPAWIAFLANGATFASLRAADLDNPSRHCSSRRACVRGRPAGRGPADGADDCVRAVADRDRGDGRIHLRSPDRAARRVRHALARARQRRLRCPADGRGRRRAGQRGSPMAACPPAGGYR